MNSSANLVSLKILMPLLAAIMAISPLAIDLYLPAIPIIAHDIYTTPADMQNTLSVYLAGYALGLIFFGPLADVVARRKMVMFGLSGFAVCSFLLTKVDHFSMFLWLRFFQAICASAATVIVAGTIREYYGSNTAKGLSYVSMIMMLAPLMAPSIGSGILAIANWPSIFYTVTAFALVIFTLSWKVLPNQQNLGNAAEQSFISRYKIVLLNRAARRDLLASIAASLAFFAYITAIPYVYLTVFEFSQFQFSLLFGLNVFALMCAHFTNTRLVTKLGSRAMLSYGLLLAVLTVSGLLAVNLLQLSPWLTVGLLFPLMSSISIIATNADALVYMRFSEHAGTATAVIGSMRFGIGALAGPILSYFANHTAIPFALLMFVAIMVVVLSQFKSFSLIPISLIK